MSQTESEKTVLILKLQEVVKSRTRPFQMKWFLSAVFSRLCRPFLALLILGFFPSILMAMDCRVVIESPTDPQRFEQLKYRATLVKNSDEFYQYLVMILKDNLQQKEAEILIQGVPNLPSFFQISELAHAVTSSTRITQTDYLKLLTKGASEFIKKGGSAREIISSPFLTENHRILALDVAKVKRSRADFSPLEKTHIWETEYNDFLDHQRSSLPFSFEVRSLPITAVRISQSFLVPEKLLDVFIKNGQVLIPINPFSTSTKIPFLKALRTKLSWNFFLTASRSLYRRTVSSGWFSVKLPTDYTNPTDLAVRAVKKDDMKEDAEQGIARARYVETIEAGIGVDPRLILLKDVLAFTDPETGNGFTVRDISPISDGRDYIPSSSILRVIAQRRIEAEVEAALLKSAQNQGRAQALMLIRYGLEMETPHRQNSLEHILDDRTIADTTVIRDLPDSQLVAAVANIIAPQAVREEIKRGYKVRELAKPNDQYVTMLRGLIPEPLLQALSEALVKSYEKTFTEELGLSQVLAVTDPQFQAALRSYHQRLQQQNQ